jgi:hypothetical protein
MGNQAFEFLRQYKQVSPETEELVLKRAKNISTVDLVKIFENGISGQYGKVYSCDPQTLLGWIEASHKSRNASGAYLDKGLLPATVKITDREYLSSVDDWCKEANKCLTSFLNGVSESYFHPHVYDRMMLDGKISLNACMKYVTGDNVDEAKQRVLRDVFLTYKSKGWNQVYFV